MFYVVQDKDQLNLRINDMNIKCQCIYSVLSPQDYEHSLPVWTYAVHWPSGIKKAFCLLWREELSK